MPDSNVVEAVKATSKVCDMLFAPSIGTEPVVFDDTGIRYVDKYVTQTISGS
jgi:hypothetical protein